MLSPRHAAPPMYKPHTPAQRAGEQARRQDVKLETDEESKGERRRENQRIEMSAGRFDIGVYLH